MNNGYKKDVLPDHKDLLECMKEVGKEMARSIKSFKNNNNISEMENDCVMQKKGDRKKSILDIVLPENYDLDKKRNQVNVVMMGKRESLVTSDYKDLFDEENESHKKTKNSVNKSFFERKLEAEKRKEQKLETLRNKKKDEEIKHSKMKPKMNKLSQKIMEKKKLEIKPIHQRVNEIVDKKYLKIERLKQLYRDIENSECSRYSTQFHEKKFEEWINKQMKWELEKKSKINTVKEENEKLETSIMRCMYHPSIDKNSEVLVTRSKILNSEHSSKKMDESVYEKLYNLKDDKYNKLVKRLVDSIPDFTPTINKNIPSFLINNQKNKKTTNFTRFIRNSNQETNINRHRQHFNSVDDRAKIDVIYEENNDNDNTLRKYNYGSTKSKNINTSYGHEDKRRVMNSSMMNSFHNPLKENEEDYEEDKEEDDEEELIAKYRKALHGDDTIKIITRKDVKKKIAVIKKDDSRKMSNDTEKVKTMHKIDIFDTNNSIYKINIRNSSAWDKDKVTNIMYNPTSNKAK